MKIEQLLGQSLPYKFKINNYSSEYIKEEKRYVKTVLCTAYIDSRDIQNLLDNIFGFDKWKDAYYSINNSTYCTISIWSDDLKGWIEKSDCGETQRDFLVSQYLDLVIEPQKHISYLQSIKNDNPFKTYNSKVTNLKKELENISKNECTNSFKRAAIKLGIGRFLYGMGSTILYTDDEYKNIIINSDERIYIKNVQAISDYCNKIHAIPNVIKQELNTDNETKIIAIFDKLYNLHYNNEFTGLILDKLNIVEKLNSINSEIELKQFYSKFSSIQKISLFRKLITEKKTILQKESK